MRISQYPGALEDILEEWLALAEIVCDNDTVISKLLERMLVTNHKERLDFIELNELL
jgi:hypothetical protein